MAGHLMRASLLILVLLTARCVFPDTVLVYVQACCCDTALYRATACGETVDSLRCEGYYLTWFQRCGDLPRVERIMK
jgi:hypothetical protein